MIDTLTMTAADGTPVTGATTPDRTSWTLAQKLAFGGDPVEVTGTSVQLSAADGDIYDWALTWDEWKAIAAAQ